MIDSSATGDRLASEPAPIRRIGIVAKARLAQAVPTLHELGPWLNARGASLLFEQSTAELAGADLPSVPKEDLARSVDLIVVLGGDGTLLSVANRIGSASVPVLAVNFGSLGFLTDVTLDELFPSLEAVLHGEAQVEERMMLHASMERQGSTFQERQVLNDVVITKAALARIVDLSVSVGPDFVSTFKADGLIISTPTGSTAYNLAAGGPIVHPRLGAIIITPIAPHMLTNRPIVIADDAAISVQPVFHDDDRIFVTFDGQSGFRLEIGDVLKVRRAAHTLHLVKAPTRNYFEVLRKKLKWGER